MKIIERQKAISLRQQGRTYPEIATCLGVSRGTLSAWLKDIPFSPKDSTKKRKIASYQVGKILHQRKLKRTSQIEIAAQEEIRNICLNELKLLGTLAYWAEGSKTQDNLVQFTNSDPLLIKLFLKWIREICKVPNQKIKVRLRIHSDLGEETVKSYWSNITAIPVSQFYKTTIKISESKGQRKRKLLHGIATVTICDTSLFYKIRGWTEGMIAQLGLKNL